MEFVSEADGLAGGSFEQGTQSPSHLHRFALCTAQSSALYHLFLIEHPSVCFAGPM